MMTIDDQPSFKQSKMENVPQRLVKFFNLTL